jgi:pimeloyl-ACP methyl ester carboxylesterase
MSKLEYTKGSVTSKDGTIIGYRQMGSGPGIILLHGGINASQHLMKLGNLLSDEFTVYIPDRRGRGMSGPIGEDYSIEKEDEDLDALLKKTGTHYVFGLLNTWNKYLLYSNDFTPMKSMKEQE